jgi:enamine deaminase RidA (YjgF/YER057c/UK114 family)
MVSINAVSNAKIYYTANGSTPATSASLYTGPINVSSTKMLNTIVVVSGQSPSAPGSARYTIIPGNQQKNQIKLATAQVVTTTTAYL